MVDKYKVVIEVTEQELKKAQFGGEEGAFRLLDRVVKAAQEQGYKSSH